VTEGGHGSGLQLGSCRNSDSEETRANGLTTDPEKEGNVGAVDSKEGERSVPASTLVLSDLLLSCQFDPSLTRWKTTLASVQVTDITLLAWAELLGEVSSCCETAA